MRQQKGYVRKLRGLWIGVWYEDRIQADGTKKHVQVSRKLGDAKGPTRISKDDAEDVLREILAPLNAGKVDVRSTMTVTQFVESEWLPHCEKNLAPATIRGYKDTWKRHLKPHIGGMQLREIESGFA